MSDELTIEGIDESATVAEAHDLVMRTHTRGGLLRTVALGGAGAALGTGVAAALPSVARAATKNDIAILNFALTLEYPAAAFFTEAERNGALSGDTATVARVVGAHERAHVRALQQALGKQAVKKGNYNFGDATENQQKFQQSALWFENISVGYIKGQAPLIDSAAVLVVALGLHSVEARHASWIRRVMGLVPAPHAFDAPISKQSAVAQFRSRGFLAVEPQMVARRTSPKVTG
jgi:hypothetical protein